MSNNLTTQSGYHGLLAANDLAQNVKHFDALFTQIAVSENGYIAIYYPWEPEVQKSAWKGTTFCPEQQERLEIIHISQVNSFDIEAADQTKVGGGAGGAVAGALIGGIFGFSGAGAVIGSSASSGKVTNNLTEVTLVINTKDFNNPRVEVSLYKRHEKNKPFYLCCPLALREHLGKDRVNLSKEGKMIAKEIYGVKNGVYEALEPNITQIETLGSTLTQMLAAHQQSETAAAAAPQLSSADELVKFKSLLDSGVITQEEFDAKKKQLLGL